MVYLTFFSALLLSGIAAYYSIIGLASIFVGAFWPVVFMGSSLEFAKVLQRLGYIETGEKYLFY